MSPHPRRTRSSRRTHEEELSPGVGHRQARLEHILHQELQALLDEASDPALGGLRILSVQLSLDAGHARVAYAVVAPFSEEAAARRATTEGLERATGYLRARLARQLDLKKLPQLGFGFVGMQPLEEGVVIEPP